MDTPSIILDFDLQKTISKNRLIGLWRMLTGFRLKYIGAVISLGISAIAKTLTFMLLRYFVDTYFVKDIHTVRLPVIALGFLGLAAVEGGFTFLSGVLASQTAEGVTRRLRNFLYDHIQHLILYLSFQNTDW